MQENITQHRESLALRLATLIRIRWLAVLGQTITVLFVYFQFGFDVLLLPCLLVIAASAWLNIFLRLRYPANARWRGQAVTALLAYDILQLAVLLFLTGGLQNPFAMLIVVPVVVSAAAQKVREVLPLFILAVMISILLVFFHMPLPWFQPGGMEMPLQLKAGIWVAIVSTMGFTSVYAYRVANESRKLADALAATEIILQREQHISNLDGLAAAAAHELGTPLATITLVAKELLLSAEKGSSLHEDAELLKSQAERCREILKKISSLSSQEDENIAYLSVPLLMEEVVEPHRERGVELVLEQTGDAPAPVTRRNAAVLYGLGNLLENAVDFAGSQVRFTCEWTRDQITFTIEDDGEGFPQNIIEKIGEPFVSGRSGMKENSGGGLGLGLFIAKTLLERNGAQLDFSNKTGKNGSGAKVMIIWTRQSFERRG